jgi:GntP family gluconate:H+ symporter
MHGLVPPHPGPLVAVTALKANLGLTLALGVLVAIPTVIIADPLFAKLAARWVDVPAPHLFDTDAPASGPAPRTETETGTTTATASRSELTVQRTRPTFGVTLATVLLPVVLMLAKALADIFLPKGPPKSVLDIIGTPLMALLIAVVVAMFTLGGSARMGRKGIAASSRSRRSRASC